MPINNNSTLADDLPDESRTRAQIQDVIKAGEEASRLLGSPLYNMAYRTLMDETFQQWLETVPKEREKREGLWNEVQGLTRVTHRLHNAVEDAARLLQEQQAGNDPGARQQEYLDQQGFGGLNS